MVVVSATSVRIAAKTDAVPAKVTEPVKLVVELADNVVNAPVEAVVAPMVVLFIDPPVIVGVVIVGVVIVPPVIVGVVIVGVVIVGVVIVGLVFNTNEPVPVEVAVPVPPLATGNIKYGDTVEITNGPL
jgi:hypothetical protein